VKLSESDRQIILGALDSLDVVLAAHESSVGERTIRWRYKHLLDSP
jgi:hypothetical protein